MKLISWIIGLVLLATPCWAADKTIPDLTTLTDLADSDLFEVSDTSQSASRSISASDIQSYILGGITLGSAASRAAADDLTTADALPDSAAIITYGESNWTTPSFDSITSGTNTTATMTVGSGSRLEYGSGGRIDANLFQGQAWIGLTAGGTGKTFWNTGNLPIPYIANASSMGEIAIGSAGEFLKVNSLGTGYEWGNPTATMTYPGAGIAVSTGSAWDTSITDNSSNWNTAYTDRMKWDGGDTGLNSSAGRVSLGLGTAAQRNAEDTMTSGANLPDGAAIISYGDANWGPGVSGNWTLSGSDIYYNSGNVGMGTTSPQYQADVDGRIRSLANSATGAASGKGLEMTYVDNGVLDAGYLLSYDRGGPSYQDIYISGDDIVFEGGGSTRMKMDSSGNFGVGTTTMNEVLNVNGRVHLSDTTAPVDPTNRLYSLSGDLYWNGTTLGSGSGSTMNVVNVKDYGATGDGVTDDTTAIQNAANALSNFEVLYFPSGTYIVSSAISITGSYKAIRGDSETSTIIKTSANSSILSFNTNSGSMYFGEITSLAFQGAGNASYSSNHGIYIYGSSNNHFSHWKFHELRFINLYAGIKVTKSDGAGGSGMRFDWNEFSTIGGNANQFLFHSSYASGTGNIYTDINCVAYNTGLYWGGANTANLGDIVISTVHFGCNDSFGTGCYFGGTASYRSRISITGCQFDANVLTAANFAGSYSHIQMRGINYGGTTTNSYSTNPTYSIIEEPDGLYGYTSGAVKTPIFTY